MRNVAISSRSGRGDFLKLYQHFTLQHVHPHEPHFITPRQPLGPPLTRAQRWHRGNALPLPRHHGGRHDALPLQAPADPLHRDADHLRAGGRVRRQDRARPHQVHGHRAHEPAPAAPRVPAHPHFRERLQHERPHLQEDTLADHGARGARPHDLHLPHRHHGQVHIHVQLELV